MVVSEKTLRRNWSKGKRSSRRSRGRIPGGTDDETDVQVTPERPSRQV